MLRCRRIKRVDSKRKTTAKIYRVRTYRVQTLTMKREQGAITTKGRGRSEDIVENVANGYVEMKSMKLEKGRG